MWNGWNLIEPPHFPLKPAVFKVYVTIRSFVSVLSLNYHHKSEEDEVQELSDLL